MDVFHFRRSGYRNQTADRLKPKTPDYRDAPHITGDLQKTLSYLKDTAGRSSDFVMRYTDIAGRDAALVYYLTVTDQHTIEIILRALQTHRYPRRMPRHRMAEYLSRHVLPNSNIVFVTNLWELRELATGGQVILLVDGLTVAITVGALSVPHRTPDTPLLEASTRGPQLAFVENLEVNIGLMRRSLNSDSLTVRQLVVGYRSRTRVALLYLHDVANPNVVETALKRIEAVHVDKLTGSATLEQRIVDSHWTIFPLSRSTARLDNCVKEVGQGKVLILVDGDPTALLIPGTIIDFFQTMEDDQHNYVEATLIRWLRIFSFFLGAYLPALYVAFTDFTPSLMPQILALQIARSREGVPFPAVVEVLIMQTVIEILREAALRLPKVMGQTIGIVGGLVLGEASVQAGLVSNILIVVIALAALSIFVMPSIDFSAVIRIISVCNILVSALFGLYGIVLLAVLVLYHLASLKSFGVEYIAPLGGQNVRDAVLDGLLRVPLPLLDRRASHLQPQEDTRSADYTNPVQHTMLEKPRRGKRRKR